MESGVHDMRPDAGEQDCQQGRQQKRMSVASVHHRPPSGTRHPDRPSDAAVLHAHHSDSAQTVKPAAARDSSPVSLHLAGGMADTVFRLPCAFTPIDAVRCALCVLPGTGTLARQACPARMAACVPGRCRFAPILLVRLSHLCGAGTEVEEDLEGFSRTLVPGRGLQKANSGDTHNRPRVKGDFAPEACPRTPLLLLLLFSCCSSWLFLLLYRVPYRHPFAPYPESVPCGGFPRRIIRRSSALAQAAARD